MIPNARLFRALQALLRRLPAPALALFTAGVTLALVWFDYVLLGLAVMSSMGIVLAIRGQWRSRNGGY